MLHLVGFLLTMNYDALNHELKMYKITFAYLFLLLCTNSSNFSDVEAFW